ncbi:MAG: histidinol phosphatase [Nitrospinae bacterium RIFCSPLOWO2_12_FULL_47_7]|nr:MAG: histidinol phosphatase [Nitrospinae bacterium RIFCSPLOWO2_12_FULL_47_7]
MNRKFEIHMHSSFSDGEFSPKELVCIAQQNGVSTLSLTDHDTFKGCSELLQAAESANIYSFPGIEITVNHRGRTLHLLAYFKSLDSVLPELLAKVEDMRGQRDQRMLELINRIDAVVPDRFRGMITFDNVRKAAEGVVARPHLAREMARLKIVPTSNDAFDRYLVKHNVEKKNLDIEEVIQLILASRGIPVLAHPGERQYSLYDPESKNNYPDVEKALAELCSFGLKGLECVYPYHEKMGMVGFYLDLAGKLGLIPTGSRDFHGFNISQRTDMLGTTKMDDTFLLRFQELWG